MEEWIYKIKDKTVHPQNAGCTVSFAPYPIPKPTGVDFDAAARLGVKAIWALSLPGKVAPVTAGRVIKNTIYNILSELGV